MAVCSVLKFPVSLLRIPISCHIHLQSAAMNNSIPDRWTEYIPIGKRIPGTRFITFKVPLKKIYDNKLASWQRFSPSDLVKEVEKQNEELGLVVDLTCTNRYYSPQELPKTIMYSKIFTVGQQVPCDGVIAQFKRIVKQYLMQNSENDKLVGVHCTHGLNRTGYLVCRYLIDMLSMEPSEAIEKFNKSRGHSIERSNYLDDLLSGKSRSNPGFAKPQVNNQRQSSKKNANSQQSPCPQQQPRNYSHATDTQRCGPRIRGPPFAQPSVHYKSGQVMGPAHGFPHSGGRYPRGPNRHHPQRPLPHHRDYGVVNGAPPQNYRPSFPQQSDNNPLNDFPARPPRSQQHRNKRPYQRHPGPGLHQKPKKQWQ